MATGGTTIVIPFNLPGGATPSTAMAGVTVFSSGNATVTAQLYAPNGQIARGGSVAVTAAVPASCDVPLGANLFTTAQVGAVRITTQDPVLLVAVLRVVGSAGGASFSSSSGFGDVSVVGGTTFGAISASTSAAPIVVANHNPVPMTVDVVAGGSAPTQTQLPPWCTAAISCPPTFMQVTVTSGGVAAVSFRNVLVPSIT